MYNIDIGFHSRDFFLAVKLSRRSENTAGPPEAERTAVSAATALVKYIFPIARILIPYIFIGGLVLAG